MVSRKCFFRSGLQVREIARVRFARVGPMTSRWTAALAMFLAGCAHSIDVNFTGGKCLIDGLPATVAQVEARQAAITDHMLSRQPILTGIAVAAVVIAGASYVQRLLAILAARRTPEQSFSDRLRARMERYRAHPIRYFALVGGVLGLLVAAGVAYVSMDADKRGSERALASLQFCHLALRSAGEQRALSDQRDHLASIQKTAGDIRALVSKLPPAEAQKAQQIASQLSTSLDKQSREVASRATASVRAVEVEVEKGIAKIDGEVVDLKTMPLAVAKLAGEMHDVVTMLGAELEACNAKVDGLGQQVATLAHGIDALAARPSAGGACPVCNCPADTAVPDKAGAGSNAGSAAPTPAPAPPVVPAPAPAPH